MLKPTRFIPSFFQNKMANYQIIRASVNDLDIVKPLWEKLNELHESLSSDFKHLYRQMNWKKRKIQLVNKSANMLVEYAIANNSNQIIAYCISTIDKDNEKIGEVDSLFVDKEYRKTGIGKQLMNNAINWLMMHKTETQKISVAAGNETVMEFYKQLGFYPRNTVLQLKK